MPEYAPKAIVGIFTTVDRHIPSAQNGGVIGDQRHGTGYHRSRNALIRAGKSGDYSIQAALDKEGDGDAASALDITLPPAEMKRVTRRLMDACKAEDPRVRALREFFGTLDGKRVTGYSPYRGREVTADASHLWHVHLSIFRGLANDVAACQDLAAVIIGAKSSTAKPAPPKPSAATGSAPKPYPRPKLRSVYLDKVRPGQQNSDSVYWVQVALNELSFRGGHELRLTGDYDAATKAEVKLFQAQVCKDPADGALGPKQTRFLFEKAGINVTIHPHS